jgi:hypothetical protein
MHSGGEPLRISTVGRSIDLRIPTNRAIAILTLAVFAVGSAVTWVRGVSWGAGLLEGLTWAGAIFLAWALARETDPDRWHSAFLAAAGGLACAVLLGPPSFLFLLWFLIGLRIINRTTGAAPGVLDVATLYGITLWLGFATHWTVLLLALPPVFFADIRRFPRGLRIALLLAFPTAAVALGMTRGSRLVLPERGWVEILVLAAIGAMAASVVASYRDVRSVGDRTGRPLAPHRVRWALGWSAAAALFLTFTGTATIQDLGPLWSAMVGTSAGWAIEKLAGCFAR